MMQLSALVADHFHLELFPAEHAFLDQHFAGRRGVDAALDDLDEFLLVIGDAAAGAPHREGRTDNRRQADILQRLKRLDQRLDLMRARRRKADASHRLAETLAILRLVDRVRRRADHFDIIFFEDAHFLQRERAIERRLPAHRREKREAARHRVAFLGDDLGDNFGRDRLNIRAVGQVRVGHDRRRIGIDEDDPIALLTQRLAGLGAGIIEFAGLPDDDRAGTYDHDGRNIGPAGHRSGSSPRPGAPEGRSAGADGEIYELWAKTIALKKKSRPVNPGF